MTLLGTPGLGLLTSGIRDWPFFEFRTSCFKFREVGMEIF